MIIEQKQYELLPVGEYPAKITNIEAEEGMFGPQLKFTFAVDGGDHDGKLLSAWTSTHFSSKSKLYSWARAAFNTAIPPEYNLNTDDLLNRKVNLTVVIKLKEDGTEFNRIETVRPYQLKQQSGPGSPPAPLFADSPI
jgi:hypothetical protein